MHTVLFIADSPPSSAMTAATDTASFSAARSDQPNDWTSRYGVGTPDFDRVLEFDQSDDLPAGRLASADRSRSCVVAGDWTMVFDAPCDYFLYVLMQQHPDLSRQDFLDRWTQDFIAFIRRTPGQVAYGRLVIDHAVTTELSARYLFDQPRFDAMALGGFGSAAELESAVLWANSDPAHARAVNELFSPPFRKILVRRPSEERWSLDSRMR